MVTRTREGTNIERQQEQQSGGIVYRRCGCRDDGRRQLGFSCPRLGVDAAHGRWYFAVQVDGVDGRRVRVRKGGFASERDARRALAEFAALPGVEAAARMWTVGRWLRFWLADIELAGGVRPTTLAGYRQVVDCYLIPEFDRLRLSKLRTKQVQRAWTGFRGVRHGRGGRSRHLLSTASGPCCDRHCRPPDGWAWSRSTPPGGYAPRTASARMVSCGHRSARTCGGVRGYGRGWRAGTCRTWPRSSKACRMTSCSRCGGWLAGLRPIRRGELVGLRWADLSLSGRELTIREQVTVTKRQERVGPPKSMAGLRTLALDETTVEIFWAHWRAVTRRRDGRPPVSDDPLFSGPDGRRLRPDWLTRRFQKLVRELDLPPVRLHDVRHGAVSLAGAAGVPVKVMQHDAGHSSAVTTVDIYQHVFAETAHAAVADTAALLLEHAKVRMGLGGASQA